MQVRSSHLIMRLEDTIEVLDAIGTLRQRLRVMMTKMPLNGLEVAQMMGIHRRTLSRWLRSEGISLRTVVNEARFGAEKQLLIDTNMCLAGISAALEFSEPAAFTRAFRRWSGTTPSAWRKKHFRR